MLKSQQAQYLAQGSSSNKNAGGKIKKLAAAYGTAARQGSVKVVSQKDKEAVPLQQLKGAAKKFTVYKGIGGGSIEQKRCEQVEQQIQTGEQQQTVIEAGQTYIGNTSDDEDQEYG